MGDDLTPKAEPNEGGDKGISNKKASDKRPKNRKKNLGSSHGNVVGASKSSLVVNAVLFGVIEAAALVLWQVADGLIGYVCVFVHWLSFICLSAGPLPGVRAAIKREGRLWFWIIYAFVWLLLAVVAYVIWHPKKPEPEPHFVLTLQLGDSAASAVILTNDCFFHAGMVNVITNANRFLLFNGIANGCIVIPVQLSESNKVFNLIVENDSPIKVTDLQVGVGFP